MASERSWTILQIIAQSWLAQCVPCIRNPSVHAKYWLSRAKLSSTIQVRPVPLLRVATFDNRKFPLLLPQEEKRSGQFCHRRRGRSVRYPNQVVEQNHWAIKRWVRPCRGFAPFAERGAQFKDANGKHASHGSRFGGQPRTTSSGKWHASRPCGDFQRTPKLLHPPCPEPYVSGGNTAVQSTCGPQIISIEDATFRFYYRT
jgi:hypothetical protein